jgi:hypothetical protein
MHSLPSPREAARLLGGEAHRDRVLCPGPGHSPGDRSLEVWLKADAPGGMLVHSFAGDDVMQCRDHVRELLGLEEWRPGRSRDWRRPIPSDLPRRSAPITVDPDQAARIRLALEIWHQARDLRGTLAETYLRSRRIEVSEDLAHALRFAPALHYDGAMVAGMVALLRDCPTWSPCGIHRTFLAADGTKIERRMLGRASGAAIMLDDLGDVVSGLHVGEGVETTLAARMLGYRPAWALGSAGAIAAFPVLPGIEAISVFTENDEASGQAAIALAARYETAGCEAFIYQPPGGDFADAIEGRD